MPALGGVPERPKGTGCKPVGSAFRGSNPLAPTSQFASPPRAATGARLSATALLAQQVEHLHGKEGVDGSSPSEGLHRSPANGPILLSALARFPLSAGTRRAHFGTGEHSRACAASPGTAQAVGNGRDC